MKSISLLLSLALLLGACNNPASENGKTDDEKSMSQTSGQDNWRQQPTVYEVNIRQYTEEGTINAFAEHLPGLKDLGIKILWIMPVQPIGEKNRKGPLGSYYSIKDYTAVNPNIGSMEDFKNMVKQAHELGMVVILDWVANHTAYDHHWTEEHPDWYTRDSSGAIVSPVEDWSDVADLNYDKKAMRNAMVEEMKFWVEEADIDGFRCDVAMMVPMDFWDSTRTELDKVKDVFMLAEAEGPEFHAKAFDMTYGWDLHHRMNEVAQGEATVAAFDKYLVTQDTAYENGDLRMYFTTNHDENSWNGTVYERMGKNHKNFFVMAATFRRGVPLVYSGQEAGLDKRLRFFDKDTISWQDTSLYPFYRKILHLKRHHPALLNDAAVANFIPLKADTVQNLYAYERRNDQQRLIVALNFGEEAAEFRFEGQQKENWRNAMNDDPMEMGDAAVVVPGNGFRLITNH